MSYLPRIVDDELDELLAALPAIALEGAKGVGKTVTGTRRAARVVALDDPDVRELVATDDASLRTDGTLLIDEWQRYPPVWDRVRRSVDAGALAGAYLLTGSAAPLEVPAHSGAGRIVGVRMRPMSLAERRIETPSVSLAALLAGGGAPIEGESAVGLESYVEEILASGFPAIRAQSGQRARRAQLSGYVSRIVERDFAEQGLRLRRPAGLRAWLTAYAAATSTTATYATVLDAATPGDADKPAKVTALAYRDVLAQLWLLDPVPGWWPAGRPLTRLTQAPKHQLADPALAANLLGADADALLSARPAGPPFPRDGSLLGHLFESLVTLSVRVYAQHNEASVHHLRTKSGDREVDLIVEGPGRRVVAFEVKLSPVPEDSDVRHLHWLRERLGADLADAAVITAGRHAYRRRDGIAVIPAALLGP